MSSWYLLKEQKSRLTLLIGSVCIKSSFLFNWAIHSLFFIYFGYFQNRKYEKNLCESLSYLAHDNLSIVNKPTLIITRLRRANFRRSMEKIFLYRVILNCQDCFNFNFIYRLTVIMMNPIRMRSFFEFKVPMNAINLIIIMIQLYSEIDPI